MTLHQLRIFESVVKHLNITKASATLHISQPSVSQQLRLLEEEFGTRFFVRLNQGVELTPEGRNFLEAIRPIVAQAENIEKTFKNNLKANKTGQLMLGGSHNVSVNVLPKLLMAFKKTHPLVQFNLETSDSRVIERRLLNSELEIALITNPSHNDEIVYEPFEEVEVVAFCLPTNPIVGKRLSLKELVACPLVMRTGGRIEKVLMSQGCKVNIAVRCQAGESVKAAVRMGMGIGILYRNAIAGRLATGKLKLINVPELNQLRFNSFVIYNRRRPLSPCAQEFLQMLREKRNAESAVHAKRVEMEPSEVIFALEVHEKGHLGKNQMYR
jgi:DNA-binding transcriptional LysR family regulator